jgi:hypothetical protein
MAILQFAITFAWPINFGFWPSVLELCKECEAM